MREIAKQNRGTHLVPLIWAIHKTKGTVAELGAGDWSTPVIHEVLRGTKRRIITYENDPNWLANFLDLENSFHTFHLIKDWNLINGTFGVILIDHAPAERRIIDIEKFKDSADILVVHDTDVKDYGYEKVYPLFKYKFTYERWTRTTTLLSNKIDVSKW